MEAKDMAALAFNCRMKRWREEYIPRIKKIVFQEALKGAVEYRWPCAKSDMPVVDKEALVLLASEFDGFTIQTDYDTYTLFVTFGWANK